MAEQLTLIGKILNTHALQGGMKLRLSVELLGIPEFIYVGLSEPPVPCALSSWNAQATDVVIFQIDDVVDQNMAKKFIGKEVFASSILVEVDDSENHKELKGYHMTDEQAGPIGVIEEIMEMPAQIMARILYNDHDVLVPLNDKIIINIDSGNQEVLVHLPEGLLDIYI